MTALNSKVQTLVSEQEYQELDLEKNERRSNETDVQSFNLDEWPAFLFLKGMGFSKVALKTNDVGIVERWLERILSYEQIFLADPDSLKVTECQWDEVDTLTGDIYIQTFRPEAAVEFANPTQMAPSVPPMLAPLGISDDARLKILYEIENEGHVEIISRFSAVLEEFRASSQRDDPVVWGFLVSDVIATALDSRLLSQAVEISETHEGSLYPVWENEERLVRLLSSYDPKANEVTTWARVFSSLPTSRLMQTIEHLLGTEAGPQVLKLLSFRAQKNPEELADFCFTASPFVQKLLLQRLSHYWKPFHYGRLLNALEGALRHLSDEDLAKLWITSLLRSSPANAFDDFEKVFRPKFIRIFSERFSLSSKRVILKALAESPSTECLDFLRRIRKNLQGDLADQVEKILQVYEGARS